jgi:hypothetical protein
VVSVVDRTWAVGASARPLNLRRAHRACVSVRHHAPLMPGASRAGVCARAQQFVRGIKARVRSRRWIPHLPRRSRSPGSHRTPPCVGTIRSRDVVAIIRRRASSLTPDHPASSTPEPPHGSTSPSPTTSSPSLQARTAENRLRRPQIHRAAVLHRRSILRPLGRLKWDPR